MLQARYVQDMVGELTSYAVTLSGNLILTVRKYTHEAEINQGESDPYFMSISYLAAEKKGIVFLLTEGGFTEIRHYEYRSKTDSYKLNRRENKVETVEHLFNRFEYDSKTSPYLQDIDFDNRNRTEVLSKDILDLPDDCRDVFREEYAKHRDALSYSEKLKQQVGNRNDPIQVIVCILHYWSKYTEEKMTERDNERKSSEHPGVFANIPNKRTRECAYIEAGVELQRIKKQLSSGRVEEQTKIKIQARLPEIRRVIKESERNKEKLAYEIEDLIEEHEPEQKDYSFREFGYGQENKHQ